MADNKTRRKQALDACDKVINGIEDNTLSVSAAVLLCRKIARLINDMEGQTWLEYEYSGYPLGKNGYVSKDAWNIGVSHGRSFREKDSNGKLVDYIFTELCAELESTIESDKVALNNYTTQGFSVSGDYALLSTSKLTQNVAIATNGLLNDIKRCERRLSILKAQYYDYAVKCQIKMTFGNIAKTVFEEYQERIEQYYAHLPLTILRKINAIESFLEDGNPERYAQVLASCRRLWSEIAKQLFEEVLPGFSEKKFKTISGEEIDITGNHDNNKLSAVIETLQLKATKNTLVGSETIYLIDWMEQIYSRQNSGVHTEISREQAMQCVIHTYIVLGDILSLKEEYDSNSKD